jgi:hypothetical protein
MRPRQLKRAVAALAGVAVIAGLLLGALTANYLLVIGIGR